MPNIESSPHPSHLFLRLFFAFVYLLAGGIVIFILWLYTSAPSVVHFEMIVNWQYAFLLIFLIGAIVSVVRRVHSRLFWEVAFTVTLYLGVWYAFLLVLPVWLALALASALTLAHLFLRTVVLHNLFFVVGAVGVSIDFAGWLSPELLLIGLVGFSLYDMLSGREGGPIEALAKLLVRQGIVPGLVLVDRWRDLHGTVDDAIKRQSVLLGAGDLILPLSLVARAAFSGPLPAALVLVCLAARTIFLTRGADFHPRAALPTLAAGAAVPFVLLRVFSLI